MGLSPATSTNSTTAATQSSMRRPVRSRVFFSSIQAVAATDNGGFSFPSSGSALGMVSNTPGKCEASSPSMSARALISASIKRLMSLSRAVASWSKPASSPSAMAPMMSVRPTRRACLRASRRLFRCAFNRKATPVSREVSSSEQRKFQWLHPWYGTCQSSGIEMISPRQNASGSAFALAYVSALSPKSVSSFSAPCFAAMRSIVCGDSVRLPAAATAVPGRSCLFSANSFSYSAARRRARRLASARSLVPSDLAGSRDRSP